MHVAGWLCLATISSVLVTVNGCKKASTVPEKEKSSDVKVEPPVPGEEPPSVLFDMKPSSASLDSAGFRFYDCTYHVEGKTARFRLQFKQNRAMAGEIPIAPGEGKFLAVAGSENSILLRDLKTALDAKKIPTSSPRVKELAFDAIVLGENQSRNSSGGFAETPPGDWILIKIFLPKGGDDGEVFLNLNPVLGKGEFSIKDSDYGDYLLKEFAKVL